MKAWQIHYICLSWWIFFKCKLSVFWTGDFSTFSEYKGFKFWRFLSVKWCKGSIQQSPAESQSLLSVFVLPSPGTTFRPPATLQPSAWRTYSFFMLFFFKSASVLLSSPNRVTAVTQPQHHLSFSTVMLQDVTDAAGRLFKHPVKRLFVLHQSFKLTRSYRRFPPVLMAAVATDITPVSPQEWIDLGTPATLSAA